MMKKESKPRNHYWKDVYRDSAPKYGLLGHQISYSLSPSIHRFVMKTLGIQEDYRLFDVPPEEFDEFFEHPLTDKISGLNITKPYKWMVAKKFAATEPVNTIFKDGVNKITANTDCTGFIKMLTSHKVQIAEVEQVIVFGGGGFAYSILKYLQNHFPAIDLTCATRKNSETLKNIFNTQIHNANELSNINRQKHTLILHATSSNDPFDPLEKYTVEFLSFKKAVFIDANYGEKRTKIFNVLHTKMHCIDGLSLLVEQARESQLLWWGKTLESQQIIQHLKDTTPQTV